MDLTWDGETLTWGEVSTDAQSVRGFREEYGPWTGRAWLRVVGPGWRIPIEPGYGELRASVREWFPARPLEARWAHGRFPSASLGIPHGWTTLLGALWVALCAAMLGWSLGVAASAAVSLAGLWLLARLRDSVTARPEGLSIGPPWGSATPWFEVEAVHVQVSGQRTRVWATTRRGTGAQGTLPTILLPALRARVARLGGLVVSESTPDSDTTYERWRGPATGMPWGMLLGTALIAPLTPEPWSSLGAGLMAVAALALLAAAVEARATGWHLGGVFWATGAYAVVVAAVSLGVAGWL